VREVGELTRSGRRIRKRVFETEPGIRVPALLVTPERVADGSPLIFVVGHDRSTVFRPDGLVDRWAGRGHRVLLADLRGMGETAPAPRNIKAPGPLGADEREAFLSFDLDRPLLGQRVHDVLRVLDALDGASRSGVHLFGIGAGGPIALHAAALDPRITRLTLERSVLSWSDVVRSRIPRDQLANVVPRALEFYDLPELAASLAPRPLMVINPIDPSQRPVTAAALEQGLDIVRLAYRSSNAEARLELRVEP
jgi:pimeloyl-ACP methyl ester carboxylesterase